ncbi:MAG: hypothetical protein AAFY11_10550 [Cyanobacteria bacterium J06641_5]
MDHWISLRVAAILRQKYREVVCQEYQTVATFCRVSAEECGLPLEDDDGRKLSAEGLRDKVLGGSTGDTIFIIPEGQNVPKTIRAWLKQGQREEKFRLLLFAPVHPRKDVFLGLTQMEIQPPSDRELAALIRSEAQRLELELGRAEVAEMLAQAGGSPVLALKQVRQRAIGEVVLEPEHHRYRDISSIGNFILGAFFIVKFASFQLASYDLLIGIVVVTVFGLLIKYMSQIQGPRRVFGQ